jgi:mono/diheme cytochrome c family protein
VLGGLALLCCLAACRQRLPAPPVPAAAPAPAPAPGATAAAEEPVDRLLRRLAAPPADAEPAGDLFELVSLLTTRDRALATPGRAEPTARLALASLKTWTGWRRSTALAAVGALAALWPAAQRALYQGGASAQLRALLADEATERQRGQALFALGALYPLHERAGAAAAAAQAADRALLCNGLRDESRFVRRQAVLGATLAREAALDGPLLAALQGYVGDAPPATALIDQADPRALRLPTSLTDEQVSELLPLWPAFVELLLSLPPRSAGVATAQALQLGRAMAAARPRSATALFLLAQVQDRRHDAAASATLRAALAVGNLPAVFLESLGARGRALQTPVDLPAARREVWRLLAARAPAGLPPPYLAPPVGSAELGGGSLRVRTVDEAELLARARAVLAGPGPGSAAARALGAELFAYYPFGSAAYYDPCLRSFFYGDNRDLAPALGLAAEGDAAAGRLLVGVVRTAPPAGPPAGGALPLKEAGNGGRFGVTCALCHAQVDAGGRRQDGLPTRTYDQGLLLAACVDQPLHHKAGNRNLADLLDYRPGRNDSSSDGVQNPTEIPSLLGLRVAGPVRWNGDTPTLAVQIDRNLSQRSAPPEIIALVAAYLRDLPLPPPPAAEPARAAMVSAGARVFARACQRCHAGPAHTSGEIVAQPVLGTDPTRVSAVLPNSTEGYKIPSLLRISRSAPYLHDGSVPTLAALLELPAPGSPPQELARRGHRFGLALPVRDRVALLAFLETL